MATDRPSHDVVLESADGKQRVSGELLEVNEAAWVLRQVGKLKIYNRHRGRAAATAAACGNRLRRRALQARNPGPIREIERTRDSLPDIAYRVRAPFGEVRVRCATRRSRYAHFPKHAHASTHHQLNQIGR